MESSASVRVSDGDIAGTLTPFRVFDERSRRRSEVLPTRSVRVIVWTVLTGVVMVVGAMITLFGVRIGVFMRVRVNVGMGVRMGVRAAPGMFMFVRMFMLVLMDVIVIMIVFRLLIAGHLWFLTVARPRGTGFGVKL